MTTQRFIVTIDGDYTHEEAEMLMQNAVSGSSEADAFAWHRAEAEWNGVYNHSGREECVPNEDAVIIMSKTNDGTDTRFYGPFGHADEATNWAEGKDLGTWAWLPLNVTELATGEDFCPVLDGRTIVNSQRN